MIKLSLVELKIFQTLRAFVKTQKSPMTLRVAGGWVRDKLLGQESTDIDIAIDNCSGERFAEMFHTYLHENHKTTQGFGVIRKNPEQSKHLETATIQVFNHWIDLVNLRGEEYSPDSRIPIITMGTPHSDAFRRDFTINALFYNINEEKVEDFTMKGLLDLELRILRTPLDPTQSFLDDPLRILRGFRFAVRFGFTFEAKAVEAMLHLSIRESFAKKVSRERIGIEFISNFEKNPNLENSFEFFALIQKSKLWCLILETDQHQKVENGFGNMLKINARLETLLSDFEYANKYLEETKKIKDWEFLQFSLLAVFTIDFFDKQIKDSKKSFLFNVVSNSLKLPNRFAELSCHLQRSLINLIEISEKESIDLEELAMWQRETGPMWKLSESLHRILFESEKTKLDLRNLFEKQQISEFFLAKSIFDGKELGNLFNVSGIQIRQQLNDLLKWQARNPTKTKDDYLKEKKTL